jgi:hypothetical protein
MKKRSRALVPVLTLLFGPWQGPVAAASVGDLNADGRVDVSDAVVLLDFVFRNGPPPAGADPFPGLPVTGVTACFGDGVQIECPAPGMPYHGQDGTYRSGRPRDFEVVRPEPDDSSTWYTIDFVTSLVWQYRLDPGRKTWTEALSAARSLRLGGFDDWRLPNISELLSIQSFEPGGPALDPSAFLGVDDPLYTTVWSSTTFGGQGGGGEGLVVDVIRGTIHTSPKEPGYQPAYARAVRALAPLQQGDLNGDGEVDLGDAIRLLFHLFAGSNAPTLRGPVPGLPATGQVECFDALGLISCASLDDEKNPSPYSGQDGHVRAGTPRNFELVKPDPAMPATWYTLDRTTGLAWQYSEELVSMTLLQALEYCEGLELGGFDDWRLPNVRELQSIADYGRSPRLDPEFFGTASQELEGRDHWEFWTSSPGLVFSMDLGFVSQSFSGSNWVRAVRTAEPPPGG